MVNAGVVQNLLNQYDVPVTDDLLEQLVDFQNKQAVERYLQQVTQTGERWQSGLLADDGFAYHF